MDTVTKQLLPAYPFGFGLSYTQFEIDTPVLEKEKYFLTNLLKVKIKKSENNGKYKGIENQYNSIYKTS